MLLTDKLVIDDDILENELNNLYESLADGFKFEDFLKPFLMNVMRFDDVRVTKKTGDGGIDLVATNTILNGVIDDDYLNSGVDNILNYKIQAKCWKPNLSIPPKEINQLRGAMFTGDRGLFITTCSYSKNAIKIAKNEIQQRERPMFLIDGKMLVKFCMINAFGFNYIPSINKEEINRLVNKKDDVNSTFSLNDEVSMSIINKKITNNDVRARILRLPMEIKEKLDLSLNKVKVKINDSFICYLTLDTTKTYMAGVTDIYRKNGLLLDNGETNEGIAKMFVEGDVLNIILSCE